MDEDERRQIRENEKLVWDRKAATYDEMQAPLIDGIYKDVIERLLRQLKKEDIVLEIGCGTGIITFGIAPNLTRLTASDVSEKMLESAREKARQTGVTNIVFKLADGFNLPEPEASYDVVLCCYVLDIVATPNEMLKEAYRVLKNKGILITVTDCTTTVRGRSIPNRSVRLAVQKIMRWLLRREMFTRPSIRELKKLHSQSGFSILEEATLHTTDDLPSLYLIAQKE